MPNETLPKTEHSKAYEWVPVRLVPNADDKLVDEGMRISRQAAEAALRGDFDTAAQLVFKLSQSPNED